MSQLHTVLVSYSQWKHDNTQYPASMQSEIALFVSVMMMEPFLPQCNLQHDVIHQKQRDKLKMHKKTDSKK